MQASAPCQGVWTNPYETDQHNHGQLPEKKKIQMMMQNHRKHEKKKLYAAVQYRQMYDQNNTVRVKHQFEISGVFLRSFITYGTGQYIKRNLHIFPI